MTRGFGPVSTGRHVAPAAASIFRIVEKHALAPLVGAAAHARELTENERVRRGFDDGDDEACEGVTDGNERANERTVGAQVYAARSGAAAEYTIDFREPFGAYAVTHRAAFCECAQRAAHATCVHERCRRACGLLLRATANATSALGIEHGGRFEPAHERLKIAQGVEATKTLLTVDEVEPQPFADEHERRTFCRRARDVRDRGGIGGRSKCEHSSAAKVSKHISSRVGQQAKPGGSTTIAGYATRH